MKDLFGAGPEVGAEAATGEIVVERDDQATPGAVAQPIQVVDDDEIGPIGGCNAG